MSPTPPASSRPPCHSPPCRALPVRLAALTAARQNPSATDNRDPRPFPARMICSSIISMPEGTSYRPATPPDVCRPDHRSDRVRVCRDRCRTGLRSVRDSDKVTRFSGTADPARHHGTRQLQREGHRDSRGPVADSAPAGHVHRPGQSQSRVGRGHRQLGGRGARGVREKREGDAARGRLGDGRGRRSRHSGGPPPEEERAGGAGDLHHASLRRQVPQDRQGRRVPHRRRSARRGGVREQRALDPARSGDQARGRAASDGLREQRPGGREAEEEWATSRRATPARASASGPTRNTSTRRRSSPPRSPRCSARRRCCCPACASPSASRRAGASRPPSGTSPKASRATLPRRSRTSIPWQRRSSANGTSPRSPSPTASPRAKARCGRSRGRPRASS